MVCTVGMLDSGYVSSSREHCVCSLPLAVGCGLPVRHAPFFVPEIASIAFRLHSCWCQVGWSASARVATEDCVSLSWVTECRLPDLQAPVWLAEIGSIAFLSQWCSCAGRMVGKRPCGYLSSPQSLFSGTCAGVHLAWTATARVATCDRIDSISPALTILLFVETCWLVTVGLVGYVIHRRIAPLSLLIESKAFHLLAACGAAVPVAWPPTTRLTPWDRVYRCSVIVVLEGRSNFRSVGVSFREFD